MSTFMGIVRDEPWRAGRVATRNYIGVFVVGNCGATAARRVADWFTPERLKDWPMVDGVVPFVHEIGCGMEMTGEPMDLLRRTIAGTIRNPNIGAALVIALGCERNNIDGFLQQEKLELGPRLQRLVMQDVGGTLKTIELGIECVKAMLPLVNDAKREAVPASELVVGLLADADDAAAAAADAVLGSAVDALVGSGGTALFSGTTGIAPVADSLPTASADVRRQLGQRIEWWRRASSGRDTRLTRAAAASEDAAAAMRRRAAAAARRAGSTPITAVLPYAQPLSGHAGLVFMDAPGDTAVAATGQIAAGATVLCLTSGEGSGFGALPAPTVKLAATTELFHAMQDDFDIDCGPAADGSAADARALGGTVFDALLRHASGDRTQAERLGLGENEFVPWPIGVLA